MSRRHGSTNFNHRGFRSFFWELKMRNSILVLNMVLWVTVFLLTQRAFGQPPAGEDAKKVKAAKEGERRVIKSADGKFYYWDMTYGLWMVHREKKWHYVAGPRVVSGHPIDIRELKKRFKKVEVAFDNQKSRLITVAGEFRGGVFGAVNAHLDFSASIGKKDLKWAFETLKSEQIPPKDGFNHEVVVKVSRDELPVGLKERAPIVVLFTEK